MTGDPGSQAQAQEDKHRQVEDMKNSILNQVLTQEARARCKYNKMNMIDNVKTNWDTAQLNPPLQMYVWSSEWSFGGTQF